MGGVCGVSESMRTSAVSRRHVRVCAARRVRLARGEAPHPHRSPATSISHLPDHPPHAIDPFDEREWRRSCASIGDSSRHPVCILPVGADSVFARSLSAFCPSRALRRSFPSHSTLLTQHRCLVLLEVVSLAAARAAASAVIAAAAVALAAASVAAAVDAVDSAAADSAVRTPENR